MKTNSTAGPTSNSPDPNVVALQAEHDVIAARLKLLTDQQASLTALLPASTAAPSSGAFTVTGSNPFPSTRLAYLEMAKLAQAVAVKVVGNHVIVFDQIEINNLASYAAAIQVLTSNQAQLDALQKLFDTDLGVRAQELSKLPAAALPAPVVPPAGLAPVLIPGLALAALKTASDLIGMFRTTTTIVYGNPAGDDVALIAGVAAALVAKGKAVYQPGIIPVASSAGNSDFMERVSGLQRASANLQYVSSLALTKLQQITDALSVYLTADQAALANNDQISAESDPAKLAALNAKQAGLERASESAAQVALVLMESRGGRIDMPAANALKAERDQFLKEMGAFVALASEVALTFNTLQTSLMALSSAGISAVTSVLRAERLASLVGNAGASVLVIKTSVLGGSVVTRDGPLKGGHLFFTGGAIISFTEFEAVTGKVLSSGTEIGDAASAEQTF